MVINYNRPNFGTGNSDDLPNLYNFKSTKQFNKLSEYYNNFESNKISKFHIN